MTTAARPTFEPARGGRGKNEGDLSALSKQYSSRDLPGQTRLKYREEGQGTQDELRSRDFRRELEEREHSSREKRGSRDPKDKDSSKRPRLDQIPAANLDADDPIDDEDEDVDSDESDEDDTAELMAELNRIKKERAAEQSRREQDKKAEDERIRTENILSGNPLLNATKGDFKVKRRWDDDVVFKNCAKGLENKTGRFVNDTLRSEFHKKFMDKYIK
ncbi:PREDICTED: spliceosome-associated protein CWC15 homolog [Priapulus caudatus]|uniref:Spliceosome-associated protein CWC15 homolog n=1 Tax=Priapulus caudatus TaxID=37621 RepID=A0ABM1ECT3_PRICU|nr:PREDICTED: spliceosome-associated protein CWC15 homolog [Priapulus caudatus]